MTDLIRWLRRSGLLACVLAFGAFATPAAAADADYEDWWLCVNDCAPDDAACVDKCTDDYNEQHKVGTSTAALKLKRAPARKPIAVTQVFLNRCPAGSHLVPFDMPIYDRNGLFIVGHKTVWICVPDDLEPAG